MSKSLYNPRISPKGPLIKPKSLVSLLKALNPSNHPMTTLWPPGACPPESNTPIRKGKEEEASPL